MPKVVTPLTDKEIKAAKPGMHADGGGLYLRVQAGGGKAWIYRYQVRVGDKLVRREMGLGSLDKLGAPEAREMVRSYVKGAGPRGDVIAYRDGLLAAEAAQRAEEARKAVTFDEVARDYIAAHSGAWKNAKHRAQWKTTLERYVFPSIGSKVVGEVTREDVRRLLAPIWTTKPETAERVRGRIEKILDRAKAQGLREGDNPAAWQAGLDNLLSKPPRKERVRHHPALPPERAGAFMAALANVEGVSARALEFAILTAARSGEVRGAKWEEFDLDKKVWTIPATRMKAKKEHHVPLSDAGIDLLNALPRDKGNPLVFPAPRGGVLSDMALLMVVRRMNKTEKTGAPVPWVDKEGTEGRPVVPHGFRATFRDWAGEVSPHPRDVIEHALAHQIPDKAEAAYVRGTAFNKRRALMADWAAWCGYGATGNVVPLLRVAA